jgi:hypothetical protein
VFCNPPYGRQITDWVRKGYEESKKPGTLVVMLIPARTDTSYFHDYIFHGKADEVRFIRGRLTFTDEDGNPTKDAKGRPCSAPFPSAVVIWRSKDMAQSLRDMVLDLIKDRDMTANEIAATLSDRGQDIPTGAPIDMRRRKPEPRQQAEADPDPEAAGRLIPGKDFDPVTGEIYEPEDDRRTNDGQTEEQPKNDGKIVVMERAAAQA